MAVDATYDDQQLLSRMMRHDKGAFEMLYRRYWLELYDAAYQRLKDSEQAEDIVQDIFLRFWQRREQLNIEHLSAYLHSAVKYRVFNYVSRGNAAKTFYKPFEEIASLAVCADARIMEKELMDLISAYIDTLPPKRRQIFTLYFEENLSTKEIAERLKVSQKTVQNLLGLAIHGLQSRLGLIILPLILAYYI